MLSGFSERDVAGMLVNRIGYIRRQRECAAFGVLSSFASTDFAIVTDISKLFFHHPRLQHVLGSYLL